MEKRVIKTVEMHTGGEPLRIIVSGYPPVHGATILDKRRYARENLDHLRVMLMSEPRGHMDMYGALLVETDLPEADMAALFMHNEGYSTMCGHAMLSLGRYAIDYKLVKPVSPETRVNIQCPCGLVAAYVQYDSETGKTGSVRFESVPGFAFAVDKTIQVDGYGEVTYDIGYGGAFYALVDAKQLQIDLTSTPADQVNRAATAISNAIRSEVNITHPENADLAFMYGTILTDGKDAVTLTTSKNVCVFADRQIDRSPCGSGVTARTAVQYHKGQTTLGLRKTFVNGKIGSEMTAMPIRVETCGCYDNAVVVEVSGCGYYTGEASFWLEEDDRLEKYECLVPGESTKEVEEFLEEHTDHTLADFKSKIEYYFSLGREISSLDDVIWFDMFQLGCHDIKHGLNELVQTHITRLVSSLAEQHMKENTRICSEYELFRCHALKVPEDSRDMIELISFMETVKAGVIKEQWEAVQASLQRLTYLLDIHTFSSQDMEQNQVTLTWPAKLEPIFEENGQLIDASKVDLKSL